jgi:hypothetical protein
MPIDRGLVVAWTTPITWTNAVLTAAQMNQQVRDNLNATAVGVASAAGQHFVATAANAIAARTTDQANVNVIETTAATSYGNLATNGPTATVTTGAKALVAVRSYLGNSSAPASTFASHDVSGASTISASDTRGPMLSGSAQTCKAADVMFLTSLTSGSNTFQMKYRVSSGTGTYDDRRIWVMAF